MSKKYTKEQITELKDLWSKIDYEGGWAEYITNYNDVKTLKYEYPYLPTKLLKSAKQLEIAYNELLEQVDQLTNDYDLDNDEEDNCD